MTSLPPVHARSLPLPGVMDFFVANGLGDAAGTWFSVCDCAIVEGVLRGVAMALDPHASDFGNPSAALWRDYALSLRRWDIRTRKDRGEHDRAWAVAEFAGTEYGRHVAEGVRGIEITGPEWRCARLLDHNLVQIAYDAAGG